MRLVCPNCGAQYEIEASLIPEPGRDVQCSSCAHQWFQKTDGTIAPAQARRAPKPAAEAPPDRAPAAARSVDVPVADAHSADAHSAVVPAADAHAAGLAVGPAAEDPGEPPAPEASDGGKRPADAGVLAVLREEALREVRARRAAEAAAEGQPDLGLDTAPAGRPGHATPVSPRPPAVSRSPELRPDLLPDIEAINATLRAVSEREAGARAAADAHDRHRNRRRGFRAGLVVSAAAAAAAVLAYAYAPLLAARMPEAEPLLEAYVAFVNDARSGVDAALGRSAAGLDRLFSGIGA